MKQTIKDEDIYNVWLPKCGCNVDEAVVHPDFYEDNGTPICPECGEDMRYAHTDVELKEKHNEISR